MHILLHSKNIQYFAKLGNVIDENKKHANIKYVFYSKIESEDWG